MRSIVVVGLSSGKTEGDNGINLCLTSHPCARDGVTSDFGRALMQDDRVYFALSLLRLEIRVWVCAFPME